MNPGPLAKAAREAQDGQHLTWADPNWAPVSLAETYFACLAGNHTAKDFNEFISITQGWIGTILTKDEFESFFKYHVGDS